MAVNDITTMLAQGGSLARPSHFSVTSTRLPSVSSFLVKAASLPAATLNTIEVPYYGRKVRIPSTRVFDTWNITVIYGSDDEGNIRSEFETWMADVQAPDSNLIAGTDVLEDWVVSLLDPADDTKVTRTIKMVGCYPTELGTVELNQESGEALAEFTATMRYTYHKNADDAEG